MALTAPLVAFALTVLLLRALLLPSARRWFLDYPNQRSLHQLPTPRTGGLGLVPGLAAGMALSGSPSVAAILALGLMVLSLLDDWRNLPAGVRLLGHLSASIVFVLGALDGLGWAHMAVFVLAVVWITNLYNFMDGADGLAGGMSLFGFGAYTCAAWLGGDHSLALACLSVAAAAAAFLVFNFPPARMFLGDAGAIPLGFLAATLGLAGWRADLWPLWFPLVVFAPFVADATLTLIRRALRGERVWEAHRTHYYQRQVLMGWSHRRLALAEYVLMAVTAGSALWALRESVLVQAVTLTLLAALYLVAALAVDLRWRIRREI